MVLSSFAVVAASFLLYATRNANAFQLGAITPKAFADRSPNTVTSNILPMTRRAGSRSSKTLQLVRKGATKTEDAQITSLEEGEEFSVPIEFGSETFEVIMDTGSSDTWLATTSFTCIDFDTGEPTDQAECEFGAALFNPSTGFTQIQNENFNITYGDGEFLSGLMGTESVTLAGITVPHQQVAAVTLAAWFGDGVTSGLVGLAYPGITSAYAGNNPTVDNLADNLIYNPIFTSMYTENLTTPLFSMAIDRGTAQGPAGTLAIGGLPPVAFTPIFGSTPIQILTIAGEDLPSIDTFYTITPEAITFPGSENTKFKAHHGPFAKPESESAFQAIVDSGTTLVYLPTAIANAISAAFEPPAQFSDDEGAYIVSCTAKAPQVGIQIGGITFEINPVDLIMDDGSGRGICISGIDDAGESGLPILGDVFLKNVVAVFDVGASEMRFAAREFY